MQIQGIIKTRKGKKIMTTEKKHNYKINDIFYNSWGYDQTNIDFYQVVGVTAKTIKVKEIKSREDQNMRNEHFTSYRIPAVNEFKSNEILVKHVKKSYDGRDYLTMEHGGLFPYEGKSLCSTSYA
jgi:hypothetical protein